MRRVAREWPPAGRDTIFRLPSFTTLTVAFRRRTKFIIVALTLTVLVAVAALVTADLWWRREIAR